MTVKIIQKNNNVLSGIVNRISHLKDKTVLVGIPENKKSKQNIEGKADLLSIPITANVGSSVQIVKIQPFLLETIHANQKKYTDFIKLNLKNIILQKDEQNNLLNKLGGVAVKDLKKYIANGKLKPFTLVGNGKDAVNIPLININKLQQSIAYKVEDNK